VSGGRRGRPQDPDADERIIAAAQKLLATEGFSRMSIEGVATESGVAKTTIYRRFTDKVELATAAIAEIIPLALPEPTGNAYEDIVAQLDVNRRRIDMSFVGTLLAEEPRSPQLLQAFRERVLGVRERILRTILEKGIEQGDVRPDLDVEAAIDLIFGSFLFRYIHEGRPDEDWPRRVMDVLWPALKAS
jgi:AcrR family transcriptional regulator